MDPYLESLIQHVETSIDNAYKNISKLPEDILQMEGMSGRKTRHLYNNICSLANKTYVEVGTYKGSSFISAMYSNKDISGTCIDNWSEFGGPKDIFYSNVKKHLTTESFTVIDKDCWSITKEDIKDPIDIFLYDGAHTYIDQKKAILYFHSFFSKYVIIMVDDWMCDWVQVKDGTLDGIEDTALKVHYSKEIPLVNTTTFHTGGDTFWNGCGVFVCERTDL
jgi:hypothetical protein